MRARRQFTVVTAIVVGFLLLALATPAAAADRADIEICSNGIDDDADGTTDETTQGGCVVGDGTPTSGDGIVPEEWTDNPDCEDLGYGYGFKIEGNEAGDYTGTFCFTSQDGVLTGGAPEDPGNCVTLFSDGTSLDWTSTLGLDAVFMKGGPNGNAYNYDPEDTGDTGLATPGGGPALSHVEFCYDYELDASKDAAGSYDRTVTWDITKDFDGDYDKNIGDAATTHDYEVSVDKTVVESNFAVTGNITVENNTPLDATIESISDVLDDGTIATVDCGVTFPYVLPSGDVLSCTYTAATSDASATLNTVTVTTSGGVDGDSAEAAVVFTANTIGFDEITISDTNGMAWSAADDATFSYTKDFACPTDTALYVDGQYSFSHINTATIDQTGQSDDATVTVDCFAPVVQKSVVEESLTREYVWEITKGDDATYDDFIGDAANTHGYSVTVTRTGEQIDSNWYVAGQIRVFNHGTLTMPISGVSDVLDDGTVASVNCGVTFPYDLAAAGTLVCSYDAAPADGTATLNTATATMNGLGFVGTADIEYAPAEEINDTVTVTDDDGVTQREFGPVNSTTTFDYTEDFQCPTDSSLYASGVYTETRTNTATLDGTDQTGTATVTLNCYAPTVTKDAAGTYDERHVWSIEKTVDPTSQGKFYGETATWTWTIDVSEEAIEENFAVTGSIYVDNPAGSPGDMIVSLVDQLDDGTFATVDCGGGATSVTVAPGAQGTCSYSADPAGRTATLNTATGTFNSLDFIGTAGVSFDVNVIGGTATVVDDQIGLNQELAAGAGPWQFTELDSGDCSTDTALYDGDGTYSFSEDNTATVTASNGQTGEASASTSVTCYAPVVTKDATGAFNERHEWTITKTVDPTSQSGFAGDTLPWTWTVTVSEESFDEDFQVTGTIYVNNPAGSPGDMVVAVADTLDDSTAAIVDCGGGSTSITVAAGAQGTCSYTANPGDASATLNTATGTFNGGNFLGTAPVSFTKTVLNGTAIVDDDQNPDFPTTLTADEGPWTFEYDDSHVCEDADSTRYVDATYTDDVYNLATVTGSDGDYDEADATTEYTCRIPASAEVVKTTTEGDEDIGQFPFTFDLYDPSGTKVETQTLGTGGGTVAFATELRAEGTWTVEEILPDGWVSTTELTCEFDVFYPAANGQVFTCDFDNVEMSRVDLLKLTNGVPTVSQVWTFSIWEGADGFGGTLVVSDATPPALIDFANTDLDPTAAYTLCEEEVPAGYSTFWRVDTDGDGVADTTVLPYNPNADDDPPEDFGNRCVDINVDGPDADELADIPLVPGTTLSFEVDNQAPGGNPRTPGYWKNWNRCTGGNQQFTADQNGGWQEGFWLLEDVLDPAIGGGVVWDDILDDNFTFPITSCEVAVDILDKRLVGDPALVGDDRKVASDPLHNLATHLLAAQLNFGAGACVTQDVLDAALDAETLLDKYNFDGNGHDPLKKKDPDADLANQLATYLDNYNNGDYCGDFVD